MFGIHDFPLFTGAGILLNLMPGVDTAYIIGRSVAHGRAAGVASALGICAGSVVHTCAAALGLSAILAASSTAFTLIKLLGAAYLVFLGARMLLERRRPVDLPAGLRGSSRAAAFRQGMLTNILNPKVALFFLAFLPQFIDPRSSSKIAAFTVLGLTFVTTGTLWCLVLAWATSFFNRQLCPNGSLGTWLNRAAGGIFVLLGLRLAASR